MERNHDKNKVPALTLIALAPLLTEVLPGATRFSSLFVFPIEMSVWGGGALLIRYVVRKWRIGWINMLFLSLALAMAEEFLIQQTSLAPMVIQIKGETYARTFGINYVYLLWALIYESVFVVFLPIHLTELIFPDRRQELWIGKIGVALVSVLFLIGSIMAWYSWTQIARITVFHVPAFNPPFAAVFSAVALISGLIFSAIGPFRTKLDYVPASLNPPSSLMLVLSGSLWAVILYGIVLLGFGILPSFPPVVAIGIGLILAAIALYLTPRWTASDRWKNKNTFYILFGIVFGSMMISFIGFIGATPIDLYFKISVDVLATILMIRLGFRIEKSVTPAPSSADDS